MGLKFEWYRCPADTCRGPRGADGPQPAPDIDWSKSIWNDPGTDPFFSCCFTLFCCGCGFCHGSNVKYIFETLFCREKDIDEKVGDKAVNPDFSDQEAPMKVKMKL